MTTAVPSPSDPSGFERLLSQLGDDLAVSDDAECGDAFKRALDRVTRFLQTETTFLATLADAERRLVVEYRSHVDADHEYGDHTAYRGQSRWLTEQLASRRSVLFTCLSELPAEAHEAQSAFERCGVSSAIFLPLLTESDTITVLAAEGLMVDDDAAALIRRFELIGRCFSARVERNRFRRTQQAGAIRYARALEELSSFVSNSPLAVIEWDAEMRVQRWNDRAEQIFGWTAEETVGEIITDFHMVIPDALLDEANEKLQRLRSGEIAGYQSRNNNYNKLGEVLNCDWYVSALRAEDGTIERMLALVLDVTNGERQREELERRRERLEQIIDKQSAELQEAQAELVKRERLAVLGQLTGSVAHELRNPLGTIHNSILMLRRIVDAGDARVDRVLSRAERSIARTESIIRELTEYARRPQLKRRGVDLDSWLVDTVQEMQLPSTIEVKWHLGLSRTVQAEPERLQRLVINLVNNAADAMAELSPPDPKRLTVSTRAENDRVVVEFLDSGPGMPPERLARVFEPLFSTKGFGVGLGLPIVEQIARQHGGDIEIRSEPGRGTNAILTLPLD